MTPMAYELAPIRTRNQVFVTNVVVNAVRAFGAIPIVLNNE